MTTPTPVIPIGGTIRSAVGRPVATAAEVAAAVNDGQNIIAGSNVQTILSSLIAHLNNLTLRAGGTPGLTSVATNATLSGNGQVATPLAVAIPLTQAEKDLLGELPPVAQIPRVADALPTAGVVAGDTVIVNGIIWRAGVIAAGTAFRLNITQGYDPAPGEDDTGYRRNRYGAVTDVNGNSVPWLDELYAEDEDAAVILRFRSATNPGSITLHITGKGTYQLTDSGATAYTIANTHGRQYESNEFGIDPFARSGTIVVTLTPTANITYWQATHADDIADWAVAGSSLIIPITLISPQIARVSQLTGMAGDISIAKNADALTAAIRNARITPAMLKGGSKTGNYIVTYSQDGSEFDAIHPNRLVNVDGTTLAFTPSNVLTIINPFTSAEQRKLAGIEPAATADQTPAQIKAAYESNPDTNAFTDALAAKLGGIQPLATADQTPAEIKAAYERNSDTNAFTDAWRNKLAGIENGATQDQTPSEIVTGLSGLTGRARLPASAIAGLHATSTGGVDTNPTLTGDGSPSRPLAVANPFTAADETKLDSIESNATADQTPAEIVATLSSLSGNARLPATAIAGLHQSATAGVATDDTISGAGTAASPLSVAAIKGYGTLALLNAVPNPTAGFIAIVFGDSAVNNGVYYRTNTLWDKIAELSVDTGLVQSEVDNRIAALRPYATDPPPVATTASAGSGPAVARGNHAHGIDTYSDSDADARVAAYTGQSSPDGTIAADRLPANIQILNKGVLAGGNRPWPDDSIQIAGPVQSAAYTASTVLAGSPVWGKSAQRGPGGTAIINPHFRIRFAKEDYAVAPALSELGNLRINVGSLSYTPSAITHLAGDATHWLADGSFARLPAGDPSIGLEIAEPTELELALTDDTVLPEDLKFATGARTVGRAVTLGEEVFDSVRIADQRELVDADMPLLRVTSAGTDSQIPLLNFTEILDLDTEPHGIIAGDFPIAIADGAPDNIGFVPSTAAVNPSKSVIVPFTTTVESVSRTRPYDPASSQYGLIVAKQDVFRGNQKIGQIVLRLARGNTSTTSTHNIVGLNAQYLAYRDHTFNDSFNANIRAQIGVLGTGSPRGTGGGQWYQFDTLPSQDEVDDFTDGDLILVKSGSDQGAYVKTSTETHAAADTGLAGITIDPTTDLISNLSGNTEHVYAARSALNSDLPAGGAWRTKASPNTMPAALNSCDMGYDHASLDAGFIRLLFASPRAYPGAINVSVGSNPRYSITLLRETSTRWYAGGLTAQEVAALRRQSWTFAEPQNTGYDIDHALTPVLLGEVDRPAEGTAAILTAATDTAPRTWPASVLGADAPKQERILDVTFDNTNQIYHQNDNNTIVGTLSRALTAADDHKIMVFEINVGSTNAPARVTANQPETTKAICAPQLWRHAAAGEVVTNLFWKGSTSESLIGFKPNGSGNRQISLKGSPSTYLNGIRITLLG